MKKAKIDKSIWLLVIIFIIVLTAALFLFFQLKSDRIAEDTLNGNQVKIILMVRDGFDLVYSELFCLDTVTGQSVMFNLPVDTGYWNKRLSRFRKISLLYRPGDTDEYVEAVELLSGVEIPYRIEMSRDQLSDLIDLIGGVELFLIDPVVIDFHDQVRMLPAGSFNMQGYQALFYLQTPLPGETNSEFVKRKQEMVKLVFHQAGVLSQDLSDGRTSRVLFSLFNADFDSASIRTLLSLFNSLDIELLQSHQIRGKYQEYDGVNLYFLDKEGVLFKQQVRQILKALKDESFIKRELLSLNLEILNGTGRNMLAARTTDHFQSYGYNIIRTANADKEDYEKTVVYVKSEEYMRAANRIAGIIECEIVKLSVTGAVDGLGGWEGADVRILLGSDYDNFRCR